MKLNLLLTNDIESTMLETCVTLFDFGVITVFFEELNESRFGRHVIVEDEVENIVKWLKPYDEVIIGDDSPQFQNFIITRIK